MSDKPKNGQFGYTVKKEFRRKKCGFYHDETDEFFKSQWQSSSRSYLYLLYRWATVIFFIVVVAISITGDFYANQIYKFFIYLTNWGILLCLITHLLSAILVTIWHFSPQSADVLLNNSVCSPVRIYWVLHTLTLPISIMITLLYWTLLYDPATMDLSASNVLEHGCNSVFMTLDLLIVAHPIRLLHIFIPLLLAVIYPLFSYIYQSSGGTNALGESAIYPTLDWNKPGTTFIVLAITYVIIIIVFFFIFTVSKLRAFIYRRYFQKSMNAVLPNTVYDLNSNDTSNGAKFGTLQNGHENNAFTNSSEAIAKF